MPITLDHALVSIYVVDANTGRVLLDQNSDMSMIPASCMKIVTTAAAYHILGPEHRFTTHLEYDGVIENGILMGNLYIHGGGDPCLGSDRFLGWKAEISTWVEAIKKMGIHTIQGRVIGDDTEWEKAKAAPSWLWEDIGNYYGAGASALSFHENAYTIVFKPADEVGKKAELLRLDPPIDDLELHNEVKTGSKDSGDQSCVYGSEFSNLQYARGTIPLGVEEFSIQGAIPNSARFCSSVLSTSLQEHGVIIEANEMPESNRHIFHTTHSPKVSEIVHEVNQKSVNVFAEHLLKEMGDGSREAGIATVMRFLTSKGIHLEGFHMADGSGLSRKNLLTAQQLVAILQLMKENPLFLRSLPEITKGVYAKSGTMSMMKAYAGYGKGTIFAIIVNNCLKADVMNEKINLFIHSQSSP